MAGPLHRQAYRYRVFATFLASFSIYSGLRTVDHVCVLGSQKAAWFEDPDGNVLCLHEVMLDRVAYGAPRRSGGVEQFGQLAEDEHAAHVHVRSGHHEVFAAVGL